jgi:VanZ family protein/alpha/beta superfamily hydrolase
VARHRSSAVPLGWLYAGLILYASLYPFGEWRVPGNSPLHFLGLAWPRYWTGFDLVSNLLGYLPLGVLVFGARVRAGQAAGASVVTAVTAGAALSFAMELLQNYLPDRVASNLDLALNVAGAACGAALGLVVHLLGGVERWQAVRERWFIDGSAGGLALLLLWPVGLLFPAPVPLGLGQVWIRLQDSLRSELEGSVMLEVGRALASRAADARKTSGWPGTRHRRTRPDGAVHDRTGHRTAGMAPLRAAGRRGDIRRCGHDLVHRHELWPGPRTRLANAQCGCRLRCRRDAGRARRAVAAAGRRGPRAGGAVGLVVLVWQAPADPYFAQTACRPGSRAASCASMAWRSGWAGCGRTRPWAGCWRAPGRALTCDLARALQPGRSYNRGPMSYYKHHIFFCLNQRRQRRGLLRRSMARRPPSTTARSGQGRRPGRPGRCARQQGRLPGPLRRRPGGRGLPRGPGTPTSTSADIDEIVESHLKNGQVGRAAAAAARRRPMNARWLQTQRQPSPGPAGAIECAIDAPPLVMAPGARRGRAVPPAPAARRHDGQQGGADAGARAVQLGWRAVRFNFRGVGGSKAPGTRAAARSTTRWRSSPPLREPGLPLVLGGFSFGGYVAARPRRALPPSAGQRLVLVARQPELRCRAVPPTPWSCTASRRRGAAGRPRSTGRARRRCR